MHTPSILEELLANDLSVEPWFFQFGRDRLAWVTLNGPEPLRSHIPRPHSRPVKRLDNGQLQWEWSLTPDHDYPNIPWRSYIPLKDEWLREGTHGWVFRKLNHDRLVDPSSSSGHFRIHPELKSKVQLTYRAIQLICDAVNQLYVPAHIVDGLPQIDWVNEEYAQMTYLLSKIWDVRRSILEHYGWVSYHLLCDSRPWRERKWNEHVVDLVDNRLRFMIAPKRGCIIDPGSISTIEVITLVRHDVPIHYQWKPQSGSIPVDAWTSPSAAAARFDPYQFKHAYDFGAYKQAGGEYTNGAKDRAILGRSSAILLSAEYLRHPRKRLYDLPKPANPESKTKEKLRCFVRTSVGGELAEINKQALAVLMEDEAGDVINKTYPSGDMKLMTLHSSPLPGLHLTNLTTFFKGIDDQAKPVDTPKLPQPITPPGAQAAPEIAVVPEEYRMLVDPPAEPIAPPLAQAMPDVAVMQEEPSTHGSVNCAPASVSAMSVDLISPGQQADPAEPTVDYQRILTSVAAASDDEDAVSLGEEPETMTSDNFASEFAQPVACTTELTFSQLPLMNTYTLLIIILNVAFVTLTGMTRPLHRYLQLHRHLQLHLHCNLQHPLVARPPYPMSQLCQLHIIVSLPLVGGRLLGGRLLGGRRILATGHNHLNLVVGCPDLVIGRLPLVGGRLPLVGGRLPLVGGRPPLVGGRPPIVGGHQLLVTGHNHSVEDHLTVTEGYRVLVIRCHPLVGGRDRLASHPLLALPFEDMAHHVTGVISQKFPQPR